MPRSVTNPVFELKLNLASMTVNTGMRVFDGRSLRAALLAMRSRSFGRVSPARFELHLLSQPETEDFPLVIPLVALYGRRSGLNRYGLPVNLLELSAHYGDVDDGVPYPPRSRGITPWGGSSASTMEEWVRSIRSWVDYASRFSSTSRP